LKTAFARDGKFLQHDDCVRPDSSPESHAKLKTGSSALGSGHRRNSSHNHDCASWTNARIRTAVAKHVSRAKAVIGRQANGGARSLYHGPRSVRPATELVESHPIVRSVEYRDLGLTERAVFADASAGCVSPPELRQIPAADFGSLEGAAGKSIHAKLNVDQAVGHQPWPIPVGCSGSASCCISSTAMKAAGQPSRGHRPPMYRRRAWRRTFGFFRDVYRNVMDKGSWTSPSRPRARTRGQTGRQCASTIAMSS